MKNIICICCPNGCHLTVDEEHDFAVTGQKCKRGEVYGKQEVKDPQRVITSTVAVSGGAYVRCPVKTNGTISKGLMFEAMKALDNLIVPAPIKLGQKIVANVCGSSVDFVAARAIEKI